MIKPPIPENEEERLAFLRKLQVLDTPLEERFERITRIVCRTLGVPISAISLVDDKRQWFKSIQGLDVAETPRDIAFCAHAILDDEPLIVLDALEDERFKGNPLVTDEPNIRFYAGYPLTVADNIRIGTLCAIDQKPRKIEAGELETLKDLAAMVRSELSNIALSESQRTLLEELKQAERASLVDSLTRVWNRAGGEQMMEREWESARRKAGPLSLALLDIDHFKQVNDTYGHDVGDQVLRHVAKTLLRASRTYDVVSRWGGEEFFIILPQCDTPAMLDVMDRFVSAVRSSPAETSAGPLTVTASIGAMTVYPAPTVDPAECIKRADRAMYSAKDNGRDRYEVAPMTEDEAERAIAKSEVSSVS